MRFSVRSRRTRTLFLAELLMLPALALVHLCHPTSWAEFMLAFLEPVSSGGHVKECVEPAMLPMHVTNETRYCAIKEPTKFTPYLDGDRSVGIM